MINKTNFEILSEIRNLLIEELNENGSIGYTMPDNKYHIFIYIEDIYDNKIYVIEPNKIIDGGHEPMGDTYNAYYGDVAGVLVGVMWCIDYFFNHSS